MQRLALEAGYDDAYVWQVEQGRRWPTVEAIWYLLHALGVSWDEFGEALGNRPELRAAPQPRRPT